MKYLVALLTIMLATFSAHSTNQKSFEAESNRVILTKQSKQNSDKENTESNTDAVHQAKSEAAILRNRKINNVFYIATLIHTVYEQNSPNTGCPSCYEYTTRTFEGFKVAYQYNLSRHFATHLSLRKGSLNSIEITDGGLYVIRKYPAEEEYIGASASLLWNLNNYRGFHLFTGIGATHDRYSNTKEHQTYSSILLDLGVGVALNNIQMSLLLEPYILSDYPGDFSAYNFHVQLGFHF